MKHPIDQFRSISWKNTDFKVASHTLDQLTLAFEAVSIEGESATKLEISFLHPTNEWKCLWDENTQTWIDHPDKKQPLGGKIEEAFVKQLLKFKFSFGGHHQQGWSRWGFSAESFQITIC